MQDPNNYNRLFVHIKSVFKALAFYVMFTIVASISGEMMTTTAFGRNLKGFWTDELYCAVNFVYSLITFFALSEIILLKDNYLKISFAGYTDGGRKPCPLIKKFIFIFRRSSFWIDIIIFTIFSLIFSGSSPFRDLRNGFPELWFCRTNTEMPFLLVILSILKALAYFTCISLWQQNPQKLRTDVATLTIVNKINERSFLEQISASIAPAIQISIIALLWSIGGLPLSLFYPMLVTFFKIGNAALVPILIISISAVLLVTVSRWIKNIYTRSVIIKKIKRLCENKGYSFTYLDKNDSSGAHFTIDAIGKRVACRFIGIPNKKTALYIDENGTAVKEIQRFFLKHRVSENYSFECEQGVQKLLIVYPASDKLFAKDEYSQQSISYGDSVLEYKIEDSRGAIRYIDLLHS